MFLASRSRLEEVLQRFLHLSETMLVVAASPNGINDMMEERMSSGNLPVRSAAGALSIYVHTNNINKINSCANQDSKVKVRLCC
jgi:hypothetical protein